MRRTADTSNEIGSLHEECPTGNQATVEVAPSVCRLIVAAVRLLRAKHPLGTSGARRNEQLANVVPISYILGNLAYTPPMFSELTIFNMD